MAKKDKRISVTEEDIKRMIAEEKRKERLNAEKEGWKYAKGAGAGMTGIGALGYGLGKYGEKMLDSGPMASKKLDPAAIKKLKKASLGMALGGTALYGISKYQHHKVKKQLGEEDNADSKK